MTKISDETTRRTETREGSENKRKARHTTFLLERLMGFCECGSGRMQKDFSSRRDIAMKQMHESYEEVMNKHFLHLKGDLTLPVLRA